MYEAVTDTEIDEQVRVAKNAINRFRILANQLNEQETKLMKEVSDNQEYLSHVNTGYTLLFALGIHNIILPLVELSGIAPMPYRVSEELFYSKDLREEYDGKEVLAKVTLHGILAITANEGHITFLCTWKEGTILRYLVVTRELVGIPDTVKDYRKTYKNMTEYNASYVSSDVDKHSARLKNLLLGKDAKGKVTEESTEVYVDLYRKALTDRVLYYSNNMKALVNLL